MPLTREAYLAHIAAEIATLAAVTRGVDPATPVPTCPGWDLAYLLGHTGSTHRWATAMVEDLAQDRPRYARAEPAEPAALSAWVAAGAEPLLRALRTTDPDARMWAWGPDQHARFWSRRMTHETTIHRADAQLAVGAVPFVEPAVAVDGIDEFLSNLPSAASFSPMVADIGGTGQRIDLVCADTDASWTIALEPTGFSWTRGSVIGPDVSVRAASSDLYLLAWGRLSPDGAQVATSGRLDVLDHWLRHARF